METLEDLGIVEDLDSPSKPPPRPQHLTPPQPSPPLKLYHKLTLSAPKFQPLRRTSPESRFLSKTLSYLVPSTHTTTFILKNSYLYILI